MSKFLEARRGYMKIGLVAFCEYIKSKYDTKKLTLLEIGAYQGESTEIFAKYFKAVHSIDSWTKETCLNPNYDMNEVIAEFDRRTKLYGNVTRTQGFSEMVHVRFANKSFDIVYIDGNHLGKFVRQDIKNYLPKCRLFISGHDYGSEKKEYQDLILAVDELLGKPDKIFQDYSWIKELK